MLSCVLGCARLSEGVCVCLSLVCLLLSEYSECLARRLCNKGQGFFQSCLAFLAVNAQLSFRSSSGFYQLTCSRSWEQPQLSFPSSYSTHFPSALLHSAITVPQGTLGCSSLYLCPVFCACSKASEEEGMEEKEASCPGAVIRQKHSWFMHLETVGVSLWCGKKWCRELGLKRG